MQYRLDTLHTHTINISPIVEAQEPETKTLQALPQPEGPPYIDADMGLAFAREVREVLAFIGPAGLAGLRDEIGARLVAALGGLH